MTDLKKLLDAATKGDWTGHNMVHAEGRPMTPEEIGEYVKNSVKMGAPDRFLFVSGTDSEGEDVDICHTGNGPSGEANTALITMARKNAERVLELEAELVKLRAGQAVAVKPLVWEEPTKLNNYCHIARTIIGDFYVGICGGRHQAWMESLVKPYEVQIGAVVGRLHEAQAIADAEYSRRILSLITTEDQQ
ncbi:MAG: hypothetical protein ABJ360_22475 [Roseobacter sp.]